LTKVYVGERDNIERALRKLKKKMMNNGILNDVRKKEFYVKPTERRKLKRAAAKKRWQKSLQSQRLPDKLY